MLMEDVSAMTNFKSHCNLVFDIDHLAFREALAELSLTITIKHRTKNLRCALHHLHLSVQVFTLVVVHEKRHSACLPIILKPFMKRRNVRRTSQRLHMIVLVKCSFSIIDVHLLASNDLSNVGQLQFLPS